MSTAGAEEGSQGKGERSEARRPWIAQMKDRALKVRQNLQPK